ncbi:ABC transporter permease [Oleomonas cavernae]|nr:ABC transporter permease [Oleomonas cavernae]
MTLLQSHPPRSLGLPRLSVRPVALPPYARYIVRRLAQALVLMTLTVIITFALLNLAKGDMVDVMAGEAGSADSAYVDHLRQRFGLDQPLLVRLGHYLGDVATLDLGYSFRQSKPVLDLITDRIGPTLLLMGSSTLLAVLGALVFGTYAARKVHRAPDGIISVVALLAYATPMFWIGLMLILVFSVKLQWLPSSGMETLFSGLTGLAYLRDLAAHLVLPTLTMALFSLALYTRLLRASLLEVLRADFVRTARAKGLKERRVIGVHALGNALLPLMTMVGMQVGGALGGAVVIESVFAWPGIGRLAYEALMSRDTNLLIGIVLFSGAAVIVLNLVVDLLYGWLDPRIERG